MLGNIDFAIHLAGQSGLGKTALVALLQQHYGPAWHERLLPGSWTSTENALEMLLFQAKDAVVVVDDFKPVGGRTDLNNLHKKADRVFRSIGNGAARGRLNGNLEQRAERRPRCLLISTGEDVPRGESLKARGVILTMVEKITQVGSEASNRLKNAQKQASAGMYATAMAGYLSWLAPRMSIIQEQLSQWMVRERDSLVMDGHARASSNTANLLIGLKCFLLYAYEMAAISKEEALLILRRCVKALHEVAQEAALENAQEKPAQQWLRLLRAAINSKSAHLTNLEGKYPGLEYGWKSTERQVTRDGEPGTEESYQPGGIHIGWIDGDDMYIDPTNAYRAARAQGSESVDEIMTIEQTLRKYLDQDKVLASTRKATSRPTLTIRKSCQGVQHDVLHLKITTLYPRQSDDATSPSPATNISQAQVPTPSNSVDYPDLVDYIPDKPASEGTSEASQVEKNNLTSSHAVDYAPEAKEQPPDADEVPLILRPPALAAEKPKSGKTVYL